MITEHDAPCISAMQEPSEHTFSFPYFVQSICPTDPSQYIRQSDPPLLAQLYEHAPLQHALRRVQYASITEVQAVDPDWTHTPESALESESRALSRASREPASRGSDSDGLSLDESSAKAASGPPST